MGVGTGCLCKHPVDSQQIVTIISPRKMQIKEPSKQHQLFYPTDINSQDDSFEMAQLEGLLTQSLHKTATFGSSLNKGTHQQTATMKMSLIQMINHTINEELSSVNQSGLSQAPQIQVSSEKKIEIKHVQVQKPKVESKFKTQNQNQNQNYEPLSRSVSMSRQRNDESVSKKDSETNTKKSILKNKGKAQDFRRGQSLRQVKQTTDDTTSQKTLKSQSKKVSFDPKIFRPKNRNFFM